MNLIITTYPSATSANVGDLLITNAFLELAQAAGVLSDCEIIFRETTLSDAHIAKYGDKPIFMPGFSISSNTYPRLYALRSHIDEIPRGLIPFGCTWQHPLGYPENAEVTSYTPQTLNLLKTIADRTGGIAVRDHMAQGILFRHGIPSITVGDCAWYHLPSKDKPMRRPEHIKNIAVTTPHSENLEQQAIDLIDMLCKQFRNADISLCLHSNPTLSTKRIIKHANQRELRIIHAAGDPTIFDRYSEFDLHVGYRLHGHIGFIRRRIPSVLLVEDARSRGFTHSIPTGCFSATKCSIGPDILSRLPLALARQHVAPDPYTVPRVHEFLTQEIETGFLRYCGIAPYLDEMLTNIVIPQLQAKVKWALKAINAI